MKKKSMPKAPGRRKLSAGATIAAALPLAIATIIPPVLDRTTSSTPPNAGATSGAIPGKATKGAAPKEFSVPISNLTEWANTVVVTMEDVTIEGNSKVHAMSADCEIHYGAHSPNYKGDPDGLVLEPMNACVEPFPGKTVQSNADWIAFSNQIKNTAVTVSGVPRIWPEHLSGGNEPSNPDHAVEMHPLTSVTTTGGQNFDFSANVYAGEYTGGVSNTTALKIAQNTTVSVTRVGNSAEISFKAGTIGNFTVLDLVIDKDSIQSDGAGSFRMNGDVVIDEETSAPVNIVTAKGSPINDEIEKIKGKRRKNVSMTTLVLFSLSPKALLDAANASQGAPVAVEKPLQLILYGPPDGN
ncbi:MAG TPA: hypothetical protein VNO50_13600 [Pyrinomonadaceae bacterium]|nr:hypothetical protein [Pyrinomonadaceae bacterium]